MIRGLIWTYILGGVFSSAIFLRDYQNLANLTIGLVLLISALVVYDRRDDIESWISGKK
ncbi:MAG TPA: hypothetical protein PLX02_12385 [Syntrophorhabdaceae bacterium]|nr:hypothetical protein [Syntrophorhabdaceae bacterium]HQM82409.1 hypothetical protein [Syntrophorhabdaceae bacterium]